MDEDPAHGVRRKKIPLSVVRPRRSATARRSRWSARATRGPHGDCVAAHGPSAKTTRPGIATRYRGRVVSPPCCSTREPTGVHPRDACGIRQDGRRLRLGRFGITEPTVALFQSGGAVEGHPARQRGARARWPVSQGVGSWGTSRARPAAVPSGRLRDRRLHRERRPPTLEGSLRFLLRTPARRVRVRRGNQGRGRGDPPLPGPGGRRVGPRGHRRGNVCSAWTACASSAMARRLRLCLSAYRVAHDLAVGGLVEQVAASIGG